MEKSIVFEHGNYNTAPHTAGPWKVDAYGEITGGFCFLTTIASAPKRAWGHSQAMAKSQEVADWCKECHDEAEANAELIAAAPDLFAVAVDIFDNYLSAIREADKTGILEKKLREAIEKALVNKAIV